MVAEGCNGWMRVTVGGGGGGGGTVTVGRLL